MRKPRKMLGNADSPYIVSLMRLIETQGKATIAAWCLGYAETNILPIFERVCKRSSGGAEWRCPLFGLHGHTLR